MEPKNCPSCGHDRVRKWYRQVVVIKEWVTPVGINDWDINSYEERLGVPWYTCSKCDHLWYKEE